MWPLKTWNNWSTFALIRNGFWICISSVKGIRMIYIIHWFFRATILIEETLFYYYYFNKLCTNMMHFKMFIPVLLMFQHVYDIINTVILLAITLGVLSISSVPLSHVFCLNMFLFSSFCKADKHESVCVNDCAAFICVWLMY